MRVIQHGENLYQLTGHPYLFPANSFLVRETDGLTLIDTGLPGSAPGILNAARTLDLSIRRIAITHAHMDHVAALDALHTALPEAEILVAAREARFLAGERTLDPAEELPGAALRGGWRTCTTRPTQLLARGDRVGSLEVELAPGHTPGHLAFFDIRDRTLLAGDAFQTQGGIAVSGVIRPLFPFPAFATWHRPTALETARVLRDLDPAWLAVGHGPVLARPGDAIDRAITTAARGR